MRTGPDCDYDKQNISVAIFTQIYVTVNQFTVAISTLSLGTLGSVAFSLAATLYMKDNMIGTTSNDIMHFTDMNVD